VCCQLEIKLCEIAALAHSTESGFEFVDNKFKNNYLSWRPTLFLKERIADCGTIFITLFLETERAELIVLARKTFSSRTECAKNRRLNLQILLFAHTHFISQSHHSFHSTFL
jgi:hypothetical protein